MRKIISNKKGFLQMSFPWIFALIVGAFILFLAIYGVSKLIGTQETLQSAEASREIEILLNPLETGFEEARTSTLTFPTETRIYNNCNLDGEFGRQLIRVSQISFNKWTETDIDVGTSNKYIFSENPVQGKKFLIFVKPFEFPFKVSDLTYITSADQKYCFVSAPDEIEEEVKNLNQENLITNCSDADLEMNNTVKVCFGGESNCDVSVNYGSKSIQTRQGQMYFETDSLMYAGIFGGKELYECHLKRLMMRAQKLAILYSSKVDLIGCGTNMKPDLVSFVSSANNLETSANLNSIMFIVEELNRKNQEASLCKLW